MGLSLMFYLVYLSSMVFPLDKTRRTKFLSKLAAYIGSLVGELDLMNVFLVEPLEAAVAEVVDHVVVQSQRIELLQSCHTNTGWTKVNGQPVPFMIRCQKQGFLITIFSFRDNIGKQSNVVK